MRLNCHNFIYLIFTKLSFLLQDDDGDIEPPSDTLYTTSEGDSYQHPSPPPHVGFESGSDAMSQVSDTSMPSHGLVDVDNCKHDPDESSGGMLFQSEPGNHVEVVDEEVRLLEPYKGGIRLAHGGYSYVRDRVKKDTQ